MSFLRKQESRHLVPPKISLTRLRLRLRRPLDGQGTGELRHSPNVLPYFPEIDKEDGGWAEMWGFYSLFHVEVLPIRVGDRYGAIDGRADRSVVLLTP